METTWQMWQWFWWKHRFAVVLIVSSVLLAQAVYWLGDPEQRWDLSGALLFLSSTITFFSAMAMFTFGSNLDFTSGKSAFPAWLFLLPIPGIRLAVIPALTMVLVLAWGWIPTATAIWFLIETPKPVSATGLIVMPWIFACAAGTWLQVVSWWPFRAAWHRLAVIAVLIFLTALWLVVCQVYEFQASYFRGGVILAAVTGFLAAIFSVYRARLYTWRSDLGTDEALPANEDEARSYASSPIRDFRSTLSALQWRDWKQLSRFPVMLMSVLAVLLALQAIFIPNTIMFLLVLFVPTGILTLVSHKLGKTSYWSRNSALSCHAAALPVSDPQFLKSRIFNLLRLSLLMWGLSLLVAGIWCLKSINRQQLAEVATALTDVANGASGWQILIAIVLASLYLVLALPLPGLAMGLSGRIWVKRTVPILLLFGVSGISTWLHRLSNGFRQPIDIPQVFPVLMSVLLGIKIALTIAGLVICKKRDLLDQNALLKHSLILSIACGLLCVLFCQLLVPAGITHRDVVLGVVTLFPCASLVFCRVALDWNRHR